MGKSRLRGSSPIYLSPSPRGLSPTPSVLEDWDAETAMESSRPTSLAIPRTASPFLNPPSLTEILSDSAPQPWTLSAFMAFLSQNHCLETLEFILDAERYRAIYTQCSMGQCQISHDLVCEQWLKIIEVYIIPSSPREVNLPAHVRDRLLRLSNSTSNPIDPSVLDEAVQIVRELMTDSVLVPFLESVVPMAVQFMTDEGAGEVRPRHSHSRLRLHREIAGSEEGHSPRSTLLPLFGKSRAAAGGLITRSHSGSGESTEMDLTDDSNSPGSTPGAEPMTPPTTPPTSDFTFAPSPNTLQRAIAGNGWKRVGAKLGLGRRNKSTRHVDQVGAPSSHPGTNIQVGISKTGQAPL
ncbi:RGS domain-containing protein [Xylariaceae sp. FL0016]|nr:RGS domain-containing protein [Xylariaceae sp. FL0016]